MDAPSHLESFGLDLPLHCTLAGQTPLLSQLRRSLLWVEQGKSRASATLAQPSLTQGYRPPICSVGLLGREESGIGWLAGVLADPCAFCFLSSSLGSEAVPLQ